MSKLFTATSLDSGTAASRCNRLLVLLLGLLALQPFVRGTLGTVIIGVTFLSVIGQAAAALADSSWDLGFKRFYIKSNSGASGPGGIVTTDFDFDRGETAEEVLTFTPENELARFEDRIAVWQPSEAPPRQR